MKTINYLISQQTSILTFDDINLIYFFKRTEGEDDVQYSMFKKIDNLAMLTNDNNIFNIAAGITSVELAVTLPDGARVEETDYSKIAKVFGLMYRKTDSNNKHYIEMIIADDIAKASTIFNDKLKSYKGVDQKTVSVFQIGSVTKTDDNEKAIHDRKLEIIVNESKISNMFIKKGLDSFKEFNRKIYACQVIDNG